MSLTVPHAPKDPADDKCLVKEPAYQQVTIRNHNTTLKLLELFEEL